jgi:hypothetical protein
VAQAGRGIATPSPAAPATSAPGIEGDVRYDHVADAPHGAIDVAYHTKYDRYGPGPVSHVTGRDAASVTVRLVRQGDGA